MARIRTVKPEFFRHEGLQDLAAKEGAHVMLVFAGLWGHCDRAGRFEWRPRTLKLDILPFLDFDMEKTLAALERDGFIECYEAEGKRYGFIPSFVDHQNIGGKEKDAPLKHPSPPEKRRGSDGEVPEKQTGSQEGNGLKGREGKGERASAPPSQNQPPPKQNQNLDRKPWPLDAVVPEPWLKRAEAERRRLSLAPLDLRVAATKFAAHYGGEGNARTSTEWEGKWIKFALDEKGNSNGHGRSGQPRLSDHPLGIFGEIGDDLRRNAAEGGRPDHANGPRRPDG